ncbi:MarR family winged helix-turn-helix transcriptional regulator [Candidatus Macondimonas diazotrophica]|jgi:DNA-binding MarR family transcriptional regulator|uniref:MarR family transcriptional regulator n=1 Tax=Candidatus Macondimonas diazotrophica TaxID=2305248 RepID=A0A4Z0FDQ3_9GAMM|nr:MarR family transcriptional regulator [Candidatus Macondimonas diazotrophica]NCU00474.1 MarR family transcriptional regulator [Candidatus Macondimonas diazotrophica]TFZ84063.1 MarR family transcriptional regulator [Candidatus Macondimonas diazotrophica]HBG31691.1 MarR family transcriptional regulator [Gammaproteobacteria bacterium]
MRNDKRHITPHFLAWARLLRVHKMLLESVQADLSVAGLPPLEWYDLLLELDMAEGNRLRLYALGEKMVLSRSNLTRLCDRLEKDGFISREQCAVDRRGLYAVLTQKGAAMRRDMWPVYKRSVEQHFSTHLTEEEADALAAILLKVQNSEP